MCEALARLTDPGVAAPRVQARETMNSYVAVRRTVMADLRPRPLPKGTPKGLSLGSLRPATSPHPTHASGESMPAYGARGLILRPVSV